MAATILSAFTALTRLEMLVQPLHQQAQREAWQPGSSSVHQRCQAVLLRLLDKLLCLPQ